MPRSLRFITPARVLTCCLALMITRPALALADTARFEIKAEPLSTALKAFAQQAHMQLLYEYDTVRDVQGNPVIGVIEKHAALTELLRNTGLEAVYTSSTAATVRPVPERALGDTTKHTSTNMNEKGKQGKQGKKDTRRAPRLTQLDPSEPVGASSPNKKSAPSNKMANANHAAAALGEVIVTGTHIRGGVTASSSISLDRETIANTGYSSMEQVMRSLPEDFGGGAERGNTLGDTGNADATSPGKSSTVNLRGLGADATLVLLNGHRLPASSSDGVTDISMLPLGIVDHIDVIPDGGSAVYGSDAIAGVVNIVTRTQYNGLQANTGYGAATDGGYDEYHFGLLAGKTWGASHILAAYDLLQQSSLLSSDRSFAAAALSPTTLLPRDKSQNAYLDGAWQIAENTQLYVSAIASNRLDDSLVNLKFSTQSGDQSITQYQASGGVHHAFGDDWMSTIYFAAGQNTINAHGCIISGTPTCTQSLYENRNADAELNADGPLFSIPGGHPHMALGVEFRRDAYEALALHQVGQNGSGDRNVSSAYAELQVPIVGPDNATFGTRRLILTAAGRFDHYSDFGSTTNPKVGVVWMPTQSISLRGSYGTSYQTPTLNELYGMYEGDFLEYLPNPSSSTGQTLVLQRAYGANPSLKPETATTWSGGFDIKPDPISGLTLSASYWRVEFRNEIVSPSAQYEETFTNPAYAPLIDYSPPTSLLLALTSEPTYPNVGFYNFTGAPYTVSAIQALVDDRYQNFARSFTDGIDFRESYHHGIAVGELTNDIYITYIMHSTFAVGAGSPAASVLDEVDEPVNLRVRADLSLEHRGWLFYAAVNYINDYTNAVVTPAVPVASWTTLDGRVAFTFPESSQGSALRNFRIAVGIQNALNAAPPHVGLPAGAYRALGFFQEPIGYDPTNASPIGRFVTLELSKAF